jgi:hypothetical protein
MSNVMGSSLGGGSLVSKTETSFDIRNESDVIGLLRFIHVNTIDPEIKNHLRDLIFTYRQTLTPDDAEKIAQSFKAMGVGIVYKDEVVAPTPQAAPVSTLGSTRPQPRFISVTPKPSALPKEEVVVAPVSTPTPPPVEKEMASAAAPIPEVIVEQNTLGSAEASERIKAIKRTVNEKVGNPVNLIETHGEVGREYMTALLEAMKKANGATAPELASAMSRLEKAFAAVEDVLGTGGVVPVKKEEQAEMKEEPTSPVPPQPMDATQPVEEKKVEEERTDSPIRLTVSSEMAHTTPRMSSVRENLAAIAYNEPPVASEPVVPPQEIAVPEEAAAVVPEEAPAIPVTPLPQEPLEPIQSVAKEKQLQELLRSTKLREAVDAKETEQMRVAAMDPLFTPEVNAGLAQLLSEWGLFKSSGIFGTGPNGDDHPLYKKISTLTMAAVIAGRFEGATPAIKQSITDYMNGWRYEEGIVHEHTETFEHYLRRVVKQILGRKGQK